MRVIISARGRPMEAAASRSVSGTSISMSSVVRTTTGTTMTASATGEMAHRGNQYLVDEQADDDRGRTQQDVVDEAHHAGEAIVPAVLGHVGAGQNAERRADEHGEHGEHQAADDRIEQAAVRA